MRSRAAPVPVSRLIMAAVSHCQDLIDRGAVTRTADQPGAFQCNQLEANFAVQMHNPIGGLIRNHGRTRRESQRASRSWSSYEKFSLAYCVNSTS